MRKIIVVIEATQTVTDPVGWHIRASVSNVIGAPIEAFGESLEQALEIAYKQAGIEVPTKE